MLIHQCADCGTLSINRIAADDDPSSLLGVFQSSLEHRIDSFCKEQGILPLKADDSAVLQKQLFGSRVDLLSTW
jgi:hypothetical protein